MSETNEHNSDGEQDPLGDADVGDTVRSEVETAESVWSLGGVDPWVGFDRDVEHITVEGASIESDGEGNDELRIRLSADVTKQAPPADTVDHDVEVDRPHTLWWFKTPIAVTLGTGVLAAATPTGLPSLLPVWTLIVVAWMGFSIVSGAYPWSMRLGP